MIDVSVYMITKNEERFLKGALECLRAFPEVGSCGRTLFRH